VGIVSDRDVLRLKYSFMCCGVVYLNKTLTTLRSGGGI